MVMRYATYVAQRLREARDDIASPVLAEFSWIISPKSGRGCVEFSVQRNSPAAIAAGQTASFVVGLLPNGCCIGQFAVLIECRNDDARHSPKKDGLLGRARHLADHFAASIQEFHRRRTVGRHLHHDAIVSLEVL